MTTNSDAKQYTWEDALAKLVELENLPPNLDTYNARPPTSESINSAHMLMLALRAVHADVAQPVPTNDGGVMLVWPQRYDTIEIDIDHTGHVSDVSEVAAHEEASDA